MEVIAANIIDFIAAIIQVGSGAVKQKSRILVIQIIQLLMQAVSMLLLGGVTGAISNVLSCFRNFLCYKEKQGLLGIIPAAVCTVYIIFMDIKDPVKFKLLVTLSFVPWAFYHFILKSYTGAIFDAATVVTNGVTLVGMIREKKNTADNKTD